MFKQENYKFKWEDIGDIQKGRPNLGSSSEVAVYRLFQYTFRNILNQEFGAEKANDVFVKAGKLAGSEFCKNILNTQLEFDKFVADLQEKLKTLNIGILRIEEADLENLHFVLTVAEDLDCSGLPVTGETVCDYDEGFIGGILEAYTGKEFNVKEIDCWASGGTVCRFSAKKKSKNIE
jgi:uncharacterized protein